MGTTEGPSSSTNSGPQGQGPLSGSYYPFSAYLGCTPVVAEAATAGNQLGAQLAHDPGWVVCQVLSQRPGELFAELAGGVLHEPQIAELKLGKKTTALYSEAKALHEQLDRHAYGPPPVRLADAEIDQARAAGVLLELGRVTAILDLTRRRHRRRRRRRQPDRSASATSSALLA